MIHYQLRCAHDHQFDGWFKDSAGYEAQVARGLVACPQCGATDVNRALMSPALSKGRKAADRPEQPPTVDQSGAPVEKQPGKQVDKQGDKQPGKPDLPAVTGPIPDHIRAMLQRLRSEVEKHCDDVGDTFAEEARRIHRGESERRGIYGETTPEQAEALADEGIEVARIPWVPRADG